MSRFENLFTDKLEALLPDMRAFARALCRDAVLADDLVQDACLKAWTARESFDEKRGVLKSWIFRILRNEFYQRTRRDWRNVQIEPPEIEACLITPCSLESRNDLSRALGAINALKPEQRDAFILVVAAGFTYKEAGEVCNCSEGTIKSRVSRAREFVLAWYSSDQPVPNKQEGLAPSMAPMDEIFNHIGMIQDQCAQRAA